MNTDVVDMLAWAMRYVRLGLYLVPLQTPYDDGSCDCNRADCTNQGKHPRTLHGLDDSSNDEVQIRKWWSMWPQANIGLDLSKSGLLDIAPDSVEWYAEFVAQGLPDTVHFASGGGEGHAHFLYVRPDDCPLYRWNESGQFDIMSNGYAVLPPSLHRSRQRYAYLGSALEAAVTTLAPRWAVDRILERTARRTRTAPPEADGAPPVRLMGDDLDRWNGVLYEPRADGSGMDRSRSLWRLAVALLGAGCSQRFAEQLIAERDVALGWEKFSHRDDATRRYAIIVERAAAGQGFSHHINLNGAATQSRPSKAPPSPLRWLSIAEFNATQDEDIAWSCVGWIGDGLITELDGKAKRSGKTTLLLSLAYSIIHGTSFLGQQCLSTHVVYLTEQSGPSFKRSVRRSGLGDDDAFTLLLWGDTKGWTWEQLIPEVLAKCDEVGAHVLIIDTLAQFSGVRGDDENRSGAALEVMEPLQAATTRPLGIMISRHDRKAGGAVGDSGRGSSAFAGAVDIILHLDRPEPKPGNERQRVVEGIGRFEETPDAVLIELGESEPQAYRMVGDVEEIKTRDLREDIEASLPTSAEAGITTDALIAAVGGRAIDVRRVLKQMLKEGEVGCAGRGVAGDPRRYYQIVPEASDDD